MQTLFASTVSMNLDEARHDNGIRRVNNPLGYVLDLSNVLDTILVYLLIVTLAREDKKQRRAQQTLQTCERVRQAVFSLHEQGIYPSLHKVQSLLIGGSMRLPEAREPWHATLQELGLKPR